MHSLTKIIQHPLVVKHRKILLYGIIGFSGAGIDLLCFLFLYNVLQLDPLVSNAISVSAGILNNFILNARYNFRVKNHLLLRFISFYAVGLIGLCVSILLLYVLTDIAHINTNISKIITIPFVVLGQYFINSRLSFAENIKRRRIDMKKLLRTLVGCLILAVIYAYFMRHVTYQGFSDEYDNILGGLLISRDHTQLYTDLFSHHMPLAYYIGAAITAFTHESLNAFRFVFLTGLFIWALYIAKLARDSFGNIAAVLLLILIASSQYITWAHMLLAETLIAYALLNVIFIIYKELSAKNKPKYSTIVQISILGAIPILSALPYAFLSVTIYAALLFIYVRGVLLTDKGVKIWTVSRDLATIIAPYMVFAIYLITTSSVKSFISQAYSFNKNYYSHFVPDVSSAGILHTMHANLVNAFDDFSQVLGFGTKSYAEPIAVFALIFVIFSLLYFAKRGSYAMAAIYSALLVSLSMRSGVYSHFFLNSGNNRLSTVYVFFVISLIILVLGQSISKHSVSGAANRTDDLTNSLKYGSILLAILLSICMVTAGLQENKTIKLQKLTSETGLQQRPNGGDATSIINKVAANSDYYWFGPFDFYVQTYVNAKRSSKYTFFAPWQGLCVSCKKELLASFRKEQPLVIYWAPNDVLLGANTDNYVPEILNYLNDNYYTYPNNPHLTNYYFLKSKRATIESRLKLSGGYY